MLIEQSIMQYDPHRLSSLAIVVKSSAHFFNLSTISFCGSVSIVEVTTKCFSSLLINGVGNSLYTVSFSAIRIILKHFALWYVCAIQNAHGST